MVQEGSYLNCSRSGRDWQKWVWLKANIIIQVLGGQVYFEAEHSLLQFIFVIFLLFFKKTFTVSDEDYS